jgi:hypothetical protein
MRACGGGLDLERGLGQLKRRPAWVVASGFDRLTQVAILRRQVKRPIYRASDRAFLAAAEVAASDAVLTRPR